MHLTPREIERLMLHTAGDLARKRKEKGLKLNYVETIAYITAELYESAREGKTVELAAGMAFAQGIFLPYGITVDDDCTSTRNGGFGSTDAR